MHSKIRLLQCYAALWIHVIDLIKHQKFQEKRNPFHNRFRHRIVRFWFAEQITFEERTVLAGRVFKV